MIAGTGKTWATSREKTAGTIQTGGVDFRGQLAAGAVLNATPTCTITLIKGGGTPSLVVSEIARISSPTVINDQSVGANLGITYLVSGGTKGQIYDMLFSCGNTAHATAVAQLHCPLAIT